MKIETSHATLKINEEGEKYWAIWEQDGKDVDNFDPGECISFNPDGFDNGTIIKIFEDVL